MPSWFCVPVSSRSGAVSGAGSSLGRSSSSSRAWPSPEHADVRAVELVGRAGQEVGAERGHVHEGVRGVVHGVHEARARPRRARGPRRGARRSSCRGRSRPRRSRAGASSCRARASRSSMSSCARLGAEPDGPDREAALLRELARHGVHVRVVVELGDDDLVARRPSARPSARARWKVSVVMLAPKAISYGRPPRKSAERFARGRERRVRLVARRVGPVRIGVVVQQVVRHRVDDRLRHLRAAGSVEVGDGQPVVHGARARGSASGWPRRGRRGRERRRSSSSCLHLSVQHTAAEHGRRRDARLAQPVQDHDRPAGAVDRRGRNGRKR